MKNRVSLMLPALLLVATIHAQTLPNLAQARLMKFSGRITDENRKPISGLMGVTFAFYENEHGGPPLWLETQNVQVGNDGRFSVMLGATKPEGVPAALFASEQARWLGVQPAGQVEQTRVLLVSVPYALKAADADTVGGLPASAFLLAVPMAQPWAATASEDAAGTANQASGSVTGTGTPKFVPLWTSTTALGNSVLFQSGSGVTAKVGINTTTPAATLDVKGGTNIDGLLRLPATGSATPTAGKNSQAQQFVASSYSSTTKAAVAQTFQWQGEPTGNNTSSPLATLNLLFGFGASAPAETGLKLSNKGVFTFAPGQKFPGAGTITGVTAGTDLTGGGTSGNVTINLDTSKVPQLAIANTFTANQTINGNLSASGLVDGSGAVFNGSGSSVVHVLENATSGEAVLAMSNNVTGGKAVIDGEANGTSGATYGVLGSNASSTNFAAGVLGQDSSSSGITFGVEGISNSSINGPRGIGVFGVNTKRSNTAGLELGNNPVGVWGDTGTFGVGVEATADEGFALAATNNSATGSFTGTFDNLQSSTHNLNVLVAEGAFGFCTQDTDGNLGCSGTKSAIVPLDRGQRQAALYAVEAPQNWFEDFGSGQLSNGSAIIRLDPDFSQTINAAYEYHVFLTPEADCEGLYVSAKTSTTFEVHELRRGRSNIAFDYRIVALRKGYEQVRMADKTQQWKQLLEQRAKTRATHLPPLVFPGPPKVDVP